MFKIFFVFINLFFLPLLVRADSYGLDEAAPGALKSSIDIPTKIGSILGSILGFTGTIFFVLVVYAGLMWMTAAGKEDQIEKAKKILAAAVIGLVIIISAYAITQFIGTAVTSK